MSNRRLTFGLEVIREFLDKDLVKILLSLLIIISVLPENALTRPVATQLSLAFFFIFGFEFVIRSIALFGAARERKSGTTDYILLFFDLIATLSFLPVELLYPPAKSFKTLRLFRLMRMFLLFRYWGPVGREIWVILMKRKYQLLFVASVVALLSFVGGTLLSNLHELEESADVSLTGAREGFDYNEDGDVDEQDRRFSSIVWWVFRQIEDPGNLVVEAKPGAILLLSLLLTGAGVFVISFLIGIGTNVVEELVNVSRGRPIGMRKHSAILNISKSSHLLLTELENYYRKHFRRARIAVLGPTEAKPDYLLRQGLTRVRYRAGNPSDVQDLKKVDVARASRIILLGDSEDSGSDASIASQLLSVRQLNPDGTILAEVFNDSNLRAAAEAGGRNTVPIPMNRFASLFLTNIVLFPGIEEIYRELLTSTGHEIYTVIFGERSIPPLTAEKAHPRPFEELFLTAFERYGIILLGVMVSVEEGATMAGVDFTPLFNPSSKRLVGADIRGFIGVSAGFEELSRFSLDFAEGTLRELRDSETVSEKVPSLRLCPDSFGAEKILISNFREGLIDFVEQLVLFLKGVAIYIMVEDAADVACTEELFIAHSERRALRVPDMVGRFKLEGEQLIYRFLDAAQRSVPIYVSVGDPSDERQLLNLGGAGSSFLKELDVMVFTPRLGCRDPDARTALGMLKIWNLQKCSPELFKPSFRMVAEVGDPEKGELLSRRAERAIRATRPCGTCTVLSKERIRNDFLAQAIFVPGISDIYTELLSEEGQDIFRLLPVSEPDGADTTVTFPEMLYTLYARDRVILVGIELEDPETCVRRMVLNPEPNELGYQFKLSELISVCVIGDTERFEGRRLFRPGGWKKINPA